jgi:hypothetical protein
VENGCKIQRMALVVYGVLLLLVLYVCVRKSGSKGSLHNMPIEVDG